jgi:ankyrin repeat protein
MRKIAFVVVLLILLETTLFGNHLCSLDKHAAENVFAAAKNGNLDVIKKYIRKGKNIECFNRYHTSVLLKAVLHNHLEAVKYLAHSGYDPEEGDMKDITPLIIATKNNYTQIALFLLDRNVSIEPVHTAIGYIDPLAAVIKHDNLSLFTKFVELGTDINNYLFRNNVPLLSLSIMRHANTIANWLFEQKADIDRPNSHGKTPLMYAAHFKNTEMFIRLLQKGADAKQRTNDNRSVKDYITFQKGSTQTEKEMLNALEHYSASYPNRPLPAHAIRPLHQPSFVFSRLSH